MIAVIEELEKLGKLLGAVVDEEMAAAAAQAREEALAEGGRAWQGRRGAPLRAVGVT